MGWVTGFCENSQVVPIKASGIYVHVSMADREVDVYVCIQICVMLSSCSIISNFATIPWTAAHYAPLSMGFSRQEYWSGLPFPSPGYLPDPRNRTGISCIAGRCFTTEPPRKPNMSIQTHKHIHIHTLIQIRVLSLYWHVYVYIWIQILIHVHFFSPDFQQARDFCSRSRSCCLFTSCEFLFADTVPLSSLGTDRHEMPSSRQLSTSSIITGCPVLLILGPGVDATFRPWEGALWPHPQAGCVPSEQHGAHCTHGDTCLHGSLLTRSLLLLTLRAVTHPHLRLPSLCPVVFVFCPLFLWELLTIWFWFRW